MAPVVRPNIDEGIFSDWKQREALAQEMVPILGRLENHKGVQMFMYGRTLSNRSVPKIMLAHRRVREMARNELSEFESHPVLVALSKLNLCPCQIDLGKLTVGYMNQSEGDKGMDIDAWVKQELAHLIDSTHKPIDKPVDVVLYGFGRIGRLVTRLLLENTGNASVMRLRAVVVRAGREGDLLKRVNLLRNDSVHGTFEGTVRIDEANSRIIANGNIIHFINADAPDKIDYTQYGIENALVIDNTGKWRDEAGLSLHEDNNHIWRLLYREISQPTIFANF